MNKLIHIIFLLSLFLHLFLYCGKNPVKDDANSNLNYNYFYYYGLNKIGLIPDLGRYAVKFKEETNNDKIKEVLLQNNLELISENPIASSLYIVKTPTNDIDKKVDIENIKEIEFVSYYFVTSNDYELFLTNTFFAKFEVDVSSEEIDSFNKQYNAKIVGEYGNNYYLLEIPWNSIKNSLEIANKYHESDLTEHASPNYVGKVKLFK